MSFWHLVKLKLINKILLFQYSERNLLTHKRAETLTLAHNTQLTTLFRTNHKLFQNFSLFTKIETHEY